MLQLLDISQNSSSPYSVEREMQKTECREQNVYQATQNLMILTECKRISKLLTFNVRQKYREYPQSKHPYTVGAG